MRTVILLSFLLVLCGSTAWAAQARELPAPVPQAQTAPILPPAKPYIPVGSVNLTEVWLQSPAARMYWNGVARPTQINMGVGSFRDPALIPPLHVGKEKPGQPGRRRAGTARASKSSGPVKCACQTPVKCTCVVPATKCTCAPPADAVKPSRTPPTAALTLPAPLPAPLSAAPQASAAPAPGGSSASAPATPPLPAVPAAGQRPPAIPKTPTRLQ